jgi:hypothetical protein
MYHAAGSGIYEKKSFWLYRGVNLAPNSALAGAFICDDRLLLHFFLVDRHLFGKVAEKVRCA